MKSLLFDDDDAVVDAPLAERMRPTTLEEVVGQTHLVGPGKPFRTALEAGHFHSFILWGPPGTGKTTLARLLARLTRAEFVPLSAVTSGIKDIKEVILAAERRRMMSNVKTILFIDEIHRFNKAQQDAFLPHVEGGTIVLVGATTENPSFEVNAALLSRSKVYVLHPLTADDLVPLLERALTDPERGLGALGIDADREALHAIAAHANGDARVALNLLDHTAALLSPGPDARRRLTSETLSGVIGRRMLLYDKSGDEHFNLISALHKSVRNSDADAGLYWLARILEAGEDPMYVARRLVRMASEDIGTAAPEALALTLAARDTAHFLGMPECNTALAQAVVYLAAAPKSNAVYSAYQAAARDATRDVATPVPLHIRNAPTSLMRELGHGEGYRYAHDEPEGVARMSCLPDHLRDRRYYQPTDRGAELKLGVALGRARAIRDGEPAG